MNQSARRVFVVLIWLLSFGYYEVKACHAIALVNVSIGVTASGVNCYASSDSPTCGCGNYWLDVEVECNNCPFPNGCTGSNTYGPFTSSGTGCYGSTQMSKPNCVVQAYPVVFIPFSGLCPGVTYKLRMREHHGTASPPTGPWSATFTFTVPGAAPFVASLATASPGTICPPQTSQLNASYTVSPNCSSTCPITLSWSPSTGLSSTTISNPVASPTVTTTYTCTFSGGCVPIPPATVQVIVSPPPVAGTPSVTPTSVCPGSNVTLSLSGYSGTGIQWQSSSSSGGPWSNIGGGTVTPFTYTMGSSTTYFQAVVTNSCGTATTTVVSVAISPNPVITVTPSSPTICAGSSTSMTASGATNYTWSPGTGLSSTTSSVVTASPLSTTVYTITGASGTCTGTTTAMVTVNPMPTVTVNSATICAGQQTATLVANGASSYVWSPSTGLSGTSGSSVTASPSSTTTFTVVGTSATCTAQATALVTVNPLPTIAVNSDVICISGSTTLTATGATSYSWNPSTGLSSSTGSSVTANPTSTTSYTVTGTNTNGCYNTAISTVTVVSNPTLTVNSATICIGQQTATLTANGASTYVWSPSTGLSSSSGSTVTGTPASTTVYTVTGTAGTCTAVATTTIVVNPLPVVTVNSGTICVGQQTATLTAAGASTYNWNPSTGLSSSSGTSVTANPTSTTSYTVTGTDANGCVNTATTSVTVNPLPTITVNNGFICVGGSMSLNANGASTYTWTPSTGLSGTNGSSVTASPASTTQYSVIGTDANGCINSDTTTVTVITNPVISVASATICTGSTTTLTANGATTYSWSPATGLGSTTGTSVSANPTATTDYTITGTQGTCTAVTTATVTVNALPVVTIGSNSPLCVNQTLNLTSGGGTLYSWNGPNSFSSTQQNPSKSSVITADGGVYTVTVTDANGCVNTNTTSVTVNTLPVVVATGATVCVNQTINLTSNNSGVTYSWIGPLSYGSNQQSPSIPNATTSMTGTYVVTVTDVNGCVNSSAAQVLVNPALVINASSNTPVCENGTLNLTSTSGVSWVWSGPNNFSSNQQNPSISPVSVNATGTYTVLGTDINGCQGTATTNVVINPLPIITANTATICVGQQTATLTANGASSYAWSPSSSLSSNTGTIVTGTPTTTTIYTITGTDGNNCVNTGTTSITVNPLPNVTVNSATICIGQQTATLTANGATGGTYTWTPTTDLSAPTGSPVTANPASTVSYSVTGIDVNGCYSSATSTVVVNPLPIVSVNSPTICKGKSTTLTASGANTYVWTPTSGLSSAVGTSVLASPTATSTYVVAGTDINGCVSTATAVVTVNPLPTLNVSPSNFSGCVPVCIAPANTTSVNGTCSWDFGDGSTSTSCTPSHCYFIQGTYTTLLTFTDNNGCVNTDTAITNAYPMPDADFTFGPQPTSILDPLIYFVDATSGAPVAAWQWSFGDTTRATSALQNPSFNYQFAGNYTAWLTVTTSYGCKDSTSKTVIINNEYLMYVPNAFSPNSDGTNDFFFAQGEGFKDFRMYIFDRWGNQIFFTDDITVGWDGRYHSHGTEILTEDVYVWKIELKTFKNETKQLSGTVVLIK